MHLSRDISNTTIIDKMEFFRILYGTTSYKPTGEITLVQSNISGIREQHNTSHVMKPDITR